MYCASVTLCGWCARQTISLSVLAQNPNKGLELEISRETGGGGGKEDPREDRCELKRNPERAVDNGGQRRAVDFELAVQRMTVNRNQKGDC